MHTSSIRALVVLVLACAALLAPEAASADEITLDFTSGSSTAAEPPASAYAETYSQDGFTLSVESGNHFELDYGGDEALSWHDGNSNTSPNILTLVKDGGGAFTVFDVDVESISNALLGGGTADPGGIVFRDSNGNTKTATSTGTFTLNWQNTTYLEFHTVNQVNTFPISLDNLRVHTNAYAAVPEPSTLALLGLGLGFVVIQRRRRSRA